MNNKNLQKERNSKVLIVSTLIFCLIFATQINSFAAGILDSTLYTGTMKLLNDLGTALIVICAAGGGVSATYFAFRRSAADEQEGKMWQKRIVSAIVAGVGGGLVGSIIKIIASYYGG